MGSTERPQLEEGSVGSIAGGNDVFQQIMNEMKSGLPKDLRGRLEKQGRGAISGGLKSGEEQLRRTFAQNGDVPVGARTDALAGLNQNANKSMQDLYLGLGDMDYKAMQNAFAKYGDLQRLALGKAATVNDARLKGYQIDSENDFSWGDALGGLFGTAGNVVGGLASGGYL